jgi:adenylosuccinate synthase
MFRKQLRRFGRPCATGLESRFTVVLGSQWGDEGKGKLVDILAKDYDVTARFNGGANAGHTIVVNGKKYALHLLPCGILYPHSMNILGNGVVINIPSMFEELEQLDRDGIDYRGRLKIATRAHLVSDIQIMADGMDEDKRKEKNEASMIGTTKRGIGPTYASKALRIGLRAGDLHDWKSFVEKYKVFIAHFKNHFPVGAFDEKKELDQLRNLYERVNGSKDKMLIDATDYMHELLQNPKKRIIAEGANAIMLDTDHGTYPYVTSSSTTLGGVCTGLGVPPQAIETSIGVVKAYTTRVGAGPFPTWLNDETGDRLQTIGHEFGATTGRKRKCGWLDLNVVKYANKINAYNSINLTKLDVLTGIPILKVATHYEMDGKRLEGSMPGTVDELAKCKPIYTELKGWTEDITKATKYSELPQNAQDYIQFIEKECKVPISWIGNGPKREEMFRKHRKPR